MGKKLKEYISALQLLIESGKATENIEAQKKELLTEISFWQHERLIHLLVTILFAMLTMSVFILILFYPSYGVLALLAALLALLVPYIKHYFILENGVQTLYVLYEDLTRLEQSEQNTGLVIPELPGVAIKPPKGK